MYTNSDDDDDTQMQYKSSGHRSKLDFSSNLLVNGPTVFILNSDGDASRHPKLEERVVTGGNVDYIELADEKTLKFWLKAIATLFIHEGRWEHRSALS